jgi:hypothetical protein
MKQLRCRAAIFVIAGIAFSAAAGWMVGAWSSMPYNVRELFAKHGLLSGAAIGAVLLLFGGLAWKLGIDFLRHPRQVALYAFPALVLTSAVVFLLIAFVLPQESIDDIVGSPVLAMPPNLERCLRFIGLAATPLLGWSLGIRLAHGQFSRYDIPAYSVWLAGFTVAYFVVVYWACTDNVTELLRSNGANWLVVGVPAWFVLTGALAAAVVRYSFVLRENWMPLAGVVVLSAFSVGLGWELIQLSTTSRLEKYGAQFSAIQFLLSPDRDHYLSSGQLSARFAVVHIVTLGYLAVCGRMLTPLMSLRW